MAVQFAYYTARIANGQRIRGYVMYNHASGTNDTTVSDGHTRTHDNIPPQPTIRANGNRKGGLNGFPTQTPVERMVACVNADIGAKHGMRADSYESGIKQHGIVVNEDTITKTKTVSVVTMEWRKNRHRFRHTRNEVLQSCTIIFMIHTCGIEPFAGKT